MPKSSQVIFVGQQFSLGCIFLATYFFDIYEKMKGKVISNFLISNVSGMHLYMKKVTRGTYDCFK